MLPRMVFHLLLLSQTILQLNAQVTLSQYTITACPDKEHCLNSTDFRLDRHCQCDTSCPEYGDCCKDSPLLRINDVQSSKFVCSHAIQNGDDIYVFMLGSCPDDWDDIQVRQGCQQPQNADPLLTEIPVTDTSTMRTYRNAYCAKCNNANASSLRIWRATLNCRSATNTVGLGTQPQRNETLAKDEGPMWNETLNKWVVIDKGTTYSCVTITPVLPPGLEDVRKCPAQRIIKECSSGWANPVTENLCKSYTAYVTIKQRLYQNIYCAFCNKKNLTRSSCQFPSPRVGFSEPPSLQLLLDFEFSVNMRVGVSSRCENTRQVYDPFFRKCRAIINLEFGPFEVPEKSPESQHPLTQPVRNRQCKMVDLNRGEFDLSSDNRSVWVHKHGVKYDASEFFFRGNGRIAVCVLETQYSFIMGVVTYTGLGISAVFLILHLCTVALLPELRNLSGNTLASLCVALLFAYISFLIGGLLQQDDKPFCTVAAVMIYYFFLAAFAWMLVLGFDVWRALVRALHFQRCRGGQWRRFLAYSLFAWWTPGVLVVAAIIVDTSDSVNEEFRPGFGLTRCWFSRELSLAIFFGAPLGVVMFFNIGFFVSAAWMAMGTRPGDSGPVEAGARRDFRLYLRLAIMVGLTWLVGLLANVWNHKWLWFAFVVLNTLQGLFIFIMFTCTAKVAKGLTKKYSWVQSVQYSLSRESHKSTVTKSGSLTGTSNDDLPESRSGSSTENAAQEKVSFLQNAFLVQKFSHRKRGSSAF